MKKLLLILALIPLFAMGQKEHVVKEYCFVMPIKNRYDILTEHTDGFVHITDSAGVDMKFKNFAHFLNYMSKQGWELNDAQPYAYPTNGDLKRFIFYRIKKEGE